jgi:hypothetical protein
MRTSSETGATKPFEGGTNTSHDPEGDGWISPADWAAAKWDGTIYHPSKMSKEEFAAAICPSVDRVRGIREVFYQHNPFADNSNPTKAEVDEWHGIAINHVRALAGARRLHRRRPPGEKRPLRPLYVCACALGRCFKRTKRAFAMTNPRVCLLLGVVTELLGCTSGIAGDADI